MHELFFITVVIFIWSGLRYAFNIICYVNIFIKNFKGIQKQTIDKRIKLIIIIPLLREQKVFREMVKRFNNLIKDSQQVKIFLVTTDKELLDDKHEESTQKLCEDLVQKLKHYVHLNYPELNGQMAHQINYVLKNIQKNQEYDDGFTYVSIYNADSNPNQQTLKIFLKSVSKFLQQKQRLPEVFQQISLFLGNYHQYKDNFPGNILKSSALMQTRWSLGYETWMFSKQSDNYLNNSYFFDVPSYVVGHGLFIKLSTLQNLNFFSEQYNNEDLPMGYFLSLQKTPIFPLPVLENSDNPDSIKQLLRQKISWFWGMIEYFDYFEDACKVKTLRNFRTIYITIYCLIRDAFAWLLRGPALLFIIIFPLHTSNPTDLTLCIITIFSYIYLPVLLIKYNLPKISQLSNKNLQKIKFNSPWKTTIYSIPYLIISSLATYLTLLNYVGYKLFSLGRFKPKTERL